MAELVHGIDDERTYSIDTVLPYQNEEYIRKLYNIRGIDYNSGEQSYSGGYLLFRYLAKQVADYTGEGYTPERAGFSWSKDKKWLNVSLEYDWVLYVQTFEADKFGEKLKNIDFSKADYWMDVKGNSNDNIIKLGSGQYTKVTGAKGNDTIYLGTRENYLYYNTGDGNDIVYNFNNSIDTIRLTSGSVVDYKVVNGNGVITTNNGAITLNGYTANFVYITDSDGAKLKYSSMVYIDGLERSSDKTSVTIGPGYQYSRFDADSYSNLKTIDASNSPSNLTIWGNNQDNIIETSNNYSSSALNYTSVLGRGGNDTIYLGDGRDTVFWDGDSYDGSDTVYYFNTEIDKIYFDESNANELTYRTSGSDIIITSKNNTTLTLKSVNNIATNEIFLLYFIGFW